MKRQNLWLIVAVLLISVLPLVGASWFVPEGQGESAASFGGADEKAQQAIREIAPNYQPWFAPLMEPASGEIASLLFALQAALGAGFIGYWLGCAVTRDRLRRESSAQAATEEQGGHAD